MSNIKLINEAREGIIYHNTTLEGAVSILESGVLLSSKMSGTTSTSAGTGKDEDEVAISFTRSKDWSVRLQETPIQLGFDQSKIANRYKIKPFRSNVWDNSSSLDTDFHNVTRMKGVEVEERVYANSIPISGNLVSVELMPKYSTMYLSNLLSTVGGMRDVNYNSLMNNKKLSESDKLIVTLVKDTLDKGYTLGPTLNNVAVVCNLTEESGTNATSELARTIALNLGLDISTMKKLKGRKVLYKVTGRRDTSFQDILVTAIVHKSEVTIQANLGELASYSEAAKKYLGRFGTNSNRLERKFTIASKSDIKFTINKTLEMFNEIESDYSKVVYNYAEDKNKTKEDKRNMFNDVTDITGTDHEYEELDPYFVDSLRDFFSDYGFLISADSKKQVVAGTSDIYGEDEFEITIEAEYPKIVVSIDNTSRDTFHPEVAKVLKTLGFKSIRNYLVFDKLDLHEDSIDILRKLIDNVQAIIQNNVEEQPIEPVSATLSNELTPKIIDTAKTLGTNLGFELSKEGKDHLSFQRSVDPGYKFDVFIDNTSATVELTKRGLASETIANDAKLRGYTVATDIVYKYQSTTDMIKKEFTKSEEDTTRYLHDVFSAYHELLRLIELSTNLNNNDDDFEEDFEEELIDPDVIDTMTNFIANKGLEVDIISDDYISATSTIETPDKVYEFGVGVNSSQITIYVEDSNEDFPTELAELLSPLGFNPYLDHRVIIRKLTDIDVAGTVSDIYDKVVETITEYGNIGKHPIYKKVVDENGKEVYKVVGMATEMTDDDKKFVRKLARQYKFRLRNVPSKDGGPGRFICTRQLVDGMNIEITIAHSNTYANLDITSKYGISDFFAGRAESVGCTYDKLKGVISCMINGDDSNFVVKIFEKADELTELYEFDPNEFIEEFEKVSNTLGYTETKVRFSDDPAYKKRVSNGEIVVQYTKPPFSSLDFEYIPDDEIAFDDIALPNGFTERYGKLNYHPTVSYWYEMKDKFELFEKELSDILGTALETEEVEEEYIPFEAYLVEAMATEGFRVVDTDETDYQIILESEFNTSTDKLSIRLDLLDRLIVSRLSTEHTKLVVEKIFGFEFDNLSSNEYTSVHDLPSELEVQRVMFDKNQLFKQLVNYVEPSVDDDKKTITDMEAGDLAKELVDATNVVITKSTTSMINLDSKHNKPWAKLYFEINLKKATITTTVDSVEQHDFMLPIMNRGTAKYRSVDEDTVTSVVDLPDNVDELVAIIDTQTENFLELLSDENNVENKSSSDIRMPELQAKHVADPEENRQLKVLVNFAKRVADEVIDDETMNTFFLEEPKERKKYRLPTVGLALTCYTLSDHLPQLKKTELYKKFSKAKKVGLFRPWAKTIDPDGNKCWMCIFVDMQYLKENGKEWLALNESRAVEYNGDFYMMTDIDNGNVTMVNESKVIQVPIEELA